MSFTVVIIGRPNVGKSTLFNRLIGKKLAIVHDMPGVTRDRREGEGQIAGMEFRVIDTAGLEEAFDESMEARMRQQTERALAEADVALMLIDSRAGVTPLDKHFADALRRQKTPVILVANKCEGRAGEPGLYEAYGLGLGEPVPISAEHGEGMSMLFEALLPYSREEAAIKARAEGFDEPEELASEDFDFERGEGQEAEEDLSRPIRVAIVGRPNVGKSTLVNRLIGEDRLLTGPEAGLTRDSIMVEWQHEGRAIQLVDTAGLRRRANIHESLEKMAVQDTLHALRHAQIVILVVDGNAILDKQDLTIARHVVEEGRGLVIAINKWDAVEDRAAALQKVQDKLESQLPQVRGITTVTMSALNGKGLDKLLDAALRVYDIWNRRVPTAQLNRWLEEMLEHHPPPVGTTGRRIKLRYMTQAKSRPPTFVIMSTSKTEELPEAYLRYLINGIRQAFKLPGVPIRLFLRKRKNPYAES